MSQVAKLKKQAADFELKRQFDKAIAVYVKLLEMFDQHSAELDVALFNRVGDLMLRQGNVADAVDYYEQGVDRYADTGFFNNAIALCNKILRYSPGRASVYYKLGRISAKKGFTNEARTNFLEYADRMQKAGNVDEAFRALTEFADQCPDQEEIRLMLAEQLTRAGRGEEAIEQYQVLYERCDRQGREEDARHVLQRMRAIDPNVEPPPPNVNLSGFPLPYRQGYADGCAGAAGGERKDASRFAADGNYRTGWQDGRAICAKK
jgi:tetratricopeptide (TPR) repeat protein